MIKAPEHNTKNEALRAVVEAFAQAFPLTSAGARIFQFTNPSQYEKERELWISEVTNRVNAHEDKLKIFHDYLFPKISISPAALGLAKVLIDSSENGLDDFIEFESVKEMLPEVEEEELELAIAELQHHGFVDFKDSQIIQRKLSLFVAFDSIFNNIDVVKDAKVLAKLLLKDNENKNIYKLFEQVPWDHRRFNPALGYLLESFPEITISKERQPDFVTTYIFLDANAKFSLMEFLKS